MKIYHLNTTDSTNHEVKRIYQKNQTLPFWVYADEQTQGRGRMGRKWEGEKGNLFTTGLYRIAQPVDKIPQLGFIASLAIADCMKLYTESKNIALKWPNDLYLKGYKCGGLLLESWSETEDRSWFSQSLSSSSSILVAIGIGINLVSHPDSLDETSTHLGLHLTSKTIEELDCPRFLNQLILSFERYYQLWQAEGFEPIRQYWCRLALGLNNKICMELGKQEISGIFKGINEQGGLILEEKSNQTRVFYSGEARFLKRGFDRFKIRD